MKLLIITGPPYSGKGTQCEVLKIQLDYEHVSTGDRCRLEKKNQTALGKLMSAYEEKGDLVPDEVMKELFSTILDENLSKRGVILDGMNNSISVACSTSKLFNIVPFFKFILVIQFMVNNIIQAIRQ